MCYENPLHLAEEIAALNLLLDQRIAIGISRSSPEQARRGWEAFGYTQETDERGSSIAYGHAPQFLEAIDGVPQADLDTQGMLMEGRPLTHARLRIEPRSLAYTAACGGVRVLAKRHNGRPNRA